MYLIIFNSIGSSSDSWLSQWPSALAKSITRSNFITMNWKMGSLKLSSIKVVLADIVLPWVWSKCFNIEGAIHIFNEGSKRSSPYCYLQYGVSGRFLCLWLQLNQKSEPYIFNIDHTESECSHEKGMLNYDSLKLFNPENLKQTFSSFTTWNAEAFVLDSKSCLSEVRKQFKRLIDK